MKKNIEIYKDKSKRTMSNQVVDAISDLIEEHTGLKPYKEQIQAAKELAKGNIVDQKTGEGKTLSIFIALLMALRDGHKVYISTSNDYLSERDYRYSLGLLNKLGYKSTFFKESIGGTDQEYKNADAIYATGETLIFDYLRGIKADYDFCIIDEIDYILVESANHDFSVSSSDSNVIMPISMFIACKKIADVLSYKVKNDTVNHEIYLFDMQEEADVLIEHAKRRTEITTSGYRKINLLLGKNAKDPLWIDVLRSTIDAKCLCHRNQQYIVEDGKIIIINDSNGRKSIGGSNGPLLHTAIEVKENVPITEKSVLHNTCSYPVFFSMFRTLTGLSGTTSYVPYDFDIIFQKKVKKIKEHNPCIRKEIYEYFTDETERLERIKKLSEEIPGPVLIITGSDDESIHIRNHLKDSSKNVVLLDNSNLTEETDIINNAGEKNNILISSIIVGRGTDIQTEVPEGLTCILARRFPSERLERQIIGRTGRNGKKGTCYILACADDVVFDLQYKEKSGRPTEKYIKKLQDRYEQIMFDTRKHIYVRSKLFFDQDAAIKDYLPETQKQNGKTCSLQISVLQLKENWQNGLIQTIYPMRKRSCF